MGIFSNRCNTPIDPVSGRALDGETLKRAMLERKSPKCRNIVKKAAKTCACGAPAPGGWVKCPVCSKWVGNESQHCWNCSTSLHPEDRTAMHAGRWSRPANLLARRFDNVDDIKSLLNKGKIIVSEGSVAILLKDGEFKECLQPGGHTLSSLGNSINHFGSPPSADLVMVDSRDISLPLHIDDLMTSENYEVELYTQLHMRVASSKKHAQAFVSKVMGDSRELNYKEFLSKIDITNEIRAAVKAECDKSTIDDLLKDPDIRLHIENAIQKVLKASCETYGYELVRVSSVEFEGEAYEQLLKDNGELELKRQRIEFEQNLQSLLNQEKMDSFKSELDLEEYITQLAQEKDITDVLRDQEMKLLKMRKAGEITAEDASIKMSAEIQSLKDDAAKAEFIMTAATTALLHKIKLDDTTAAARRKQALDDAENAAKIRAIEHQSDLNETDGWIIEKAKKRKMEEEAEQQRRLNEQQIAHQNKQLDARLKIELIKALSGTSIEDKIMVAENKDQIEALKELSQIKLQEGMSTQEILAMAAGKSPEAAKALADMAGMENNQYERLMQETKEMYKDRQGHDERISDKAMDTVAEGLKNKGSDAGGTTNIVK